MLNATAFSASWLYVPLSIPPLVNRPKNLTKEEFWAHQAANSHYVIGTDAARISIDSPTWGGGWTCNCPGQDYHAWGEYDISTFAEFFRAYNFPSTAEQLSLLDQINLFEAIVVVLACDAVLKTLPPNRPAHVVLFVWCDNTSAIAWLTKYKNNHPVINYVLQVWARLQAEYSATINSGHIKGEFNTVPDAISRHFQVLNGSSIQALLSHLTPHQHLPHWYQGLLTCSTQPSDIAWQLAASSLTKLARGL
jgi:hypothetical protein